MSVELHPAEERDLVAVLRMNNEAVPHVSELQYPALREFWETAPYFKVARDASDDTLQGFLIALTPEAEYTSPNFRWFQARYEHFCYIDRIVVAPEARGAGLGQLFYRDLQTVSRATAHRLSCEVNLDPPNEDSLRFHTRFGFAEVGRQKTDHGKKTVCLMVKELD